MFFPGSRYEKQTTYQVQRADGSIVQAVRLPLPGPQLLLGFVRQTDPRRLDLIASRFINNATAFWRICDANNAVVPDALGARDLIGVPIDSPAGH
jgi:hypothetical protein